MKIFVHFEDIKNSFRKLLKRFPLETVMIIAITSIIFFAIHKEDFSGWIPRTLYTLATTLFFLLGTTLYVESRKSDEWKYLFLLLPIIYGIGFFFANPYISQDDIGTIVFFLLHIFGFGLVIFFAPYLKNIFSADKNTIIEHTNYFTLVSWTKIMSAIVGGSVLLLGFIAIGSVRELFDLTGEFWDGKINGHWATFSLSLVAPLYALIHFPELKEIKKNTYDTNRFFSFLVRFVGIPFILVYFIILYAYSVRVLMNFQDWPNGIISWLVIGFSIFGYLVFIFSESYAAEGKFIKWFRKYFPFAVLPQILMLFYAIYLRIAQYDLTMNRYFVVVFGIWLTIVSLYYTAWKRKLILFIPATLTIISILISFGPWGVFSLPLERQYNRFVSNMEKTGILQDGKIVPLAKSIDMDMENEMVSEIEYLCQYKTCEKIRPFFEKALKDAEQKRKHQNDVSWISRYERTLSSWEASNAIEWAIGIQRRYESNVSQNREYIYLNVDYKERDSFYPLDVSEYDSLVQVVGINTSAPVAAFISIDIDNELLTVRDGAKTESFSITDFVQKLQSTHGSTDSHNMNQKDLELTLVSENHTIRVLFESFSYKNPKYDKNKANVYDSSLSINGIALVKTKK